MKSRNYPKGPMTMARESVEQLRSAIVADTAELATLKERRDTLKRQAAEVGREYTKVNARRDRRIKRARDGGATTDQLAADAQLSVARIRQLAPGGKIGRPPKRTGPGPGAAAVDEQLVDVDSARLVYDAIEGRPSPAAELVAHVRQHPGPLARTAENAARVAELGRGDFPTPPLDRSQLSDIAAAVHRGKRPARQLRPARGPLDIPGRVQQALAEHGGDVDAATAALVAGAIPDAMQLLDQCRAGSTYDYTAHPSIPDPLKRPGKKQADMIWEGRPRYTNPDTAKGTPIEILDMNGAYLSALKRTHLPIGRLVEDAPGTPFNSKRSGIYLIEPTPWHHRHLPNPLGDGREERGPVWISGATMRLLLRAHRADLLDQAPVILESHTSGSSENLLTKFGEQLAAARRQALADDDAVTLEYVKAMYSKFVSTAGDSRANHEVFRPDWVHEIRSQAYANLWYKAAKARLHGVHVHRMMGTDELHLSPVWRGTLVGGKPMFTLGRDLPQVKVKGSYRVGESGDA